MTPQQIQTLELAGRVQYFTIEHLTYMGIFNATSTARKHMRDLRESGFLTESHYGVTRGVGRLPALYGLTPKAVRYLVDVEGHNIDAIKVSKSNKNQPYEVKAPQDYFHRVGTLDTMLAMLRELDRRGTKEDFTELYFRRFGMHEARRTAIELSDSRLEPDAIITFTTEEKPRLYLVEFYEDSINVERIRRAIMRHAEAIATGAPSLALNINVGHRVLLVFRHEHTARAVMDFIKHTPALTQVKDRFLFKTHESIMKDAFDHWGNVDGGRVNIF